MLLSVTTRWFNEERFARRFLANWHIADEIIIADGGSTDNSRAILTADSRVRWFDFLEKVPGRNGGERNPEGRHINFVLSQAKGEWIAHTEADAWPFIGLSAVLRTILLQTEAPAIFSWLYYMGPTCTYHYPRLLQGPGTTAWRRSLNLGCDPDSLFEPALHIPREIEEAALKLPKELARAHMTYESEDWIAYKRKFYKQVHGLDQKHPDETWVDKEALPSWARWYESEIEHPDEYVLAKAAMNAVKYGGWLA